MRTTTTLLSSALCLALLAVSAHAVVVRRAPEFTFPGVGNRAQALRSLRGQPVVLLIAQSPRTGAFRRQLKELRDIYSQFASRQAVFIAAFQEGEGPVESNIPFTVANNGSAVAAAFGVQDGFNLIVIGKDGNIDYQTSKVVPAERIRDVIQNSFAVQAQARKGR
jgi:hypothetical protein